MAITKSQIYTLLGFGVLILLLMAMRTKPQDLLDKEKNRSLNLQSTDVNILKQEAAATLSDNNKARIQILESELGKADEDTIDDIYKDLSSVWYDAGEIGIAGHYAEEVATKNEDAASWGIAGTTYALCVKRSKKDKEKTLCLSKAIEALENAISLDPEDLSYQINRAVILAENPPPSNPMQGVKLLLDLNKNFPKNVPVINNIAKFAIQTNQLDKAEQRLLGAIELDPTNVTSYCLLVKLYNAKGENDKASIYQAKCQ